jgi:hypothetical protein
MPINFKKDTASSYPEFESGARSIQIRLPSDQELDSDSEWWIPGATEDKLVVLGGVEPEHYDRYTGLGLQFTDAKQRFQVYSRKPNGAWKEKIGEYDQEPEGTDWFTDAKGKRTRLTPDGNAVDPVIYLHGVRRGDSRVLTLRFPGVQRSSFAKLINQAKRAKNKDGDSVPLWGTRWQAILGKKAGWRPAL